MAGHLQIFAFSHFLAVSLPVEYYETTGGLLWLIPHVNTPWQKDKDSNVTNFGNNLHINNHVFLQKKKEKVRRNLVAETQISMRQRCLQKHVSAPHITRSTERYWRQTKVCRWLLSWVASWRSKHVWHLQRHSYKTRCCHVHLVQRGTSPNSYDFHKLSNRSSGAYFPRIMTVPGSSFSASHFREHYNRSQKTRRLGVNATQFGPALTSSEYKTYFLVRESLVSVFEFGILSRLFCLTP